MTDVVEIGMGKSGRRAYGFDDVSIVPSRRTRDPEEVSTAWEIDAYRFGLPVLGAAMDSVSSPASVVELGRLGGLGVLNLEGLWTRYDDPQPLLDTIAGIGLPYIASAFCIFFLRQAFMGVPNELVEAAQIEGASRLEILWKVFLPAAKPSLVAYALVSISTQWNNFLWPLIVATTDSTRPITVGLVRFLAPETGLDFPRMAAGTVIVIAPLLAVFVIGQRGFINSFLRSGIK